ncbi:uncharacterized protein LOC122342847 [Puntigrus tetrazona]|uniref:uncharacterized protein LOC122342847 n=1 Tax=Puntigrus tetrazona TaxID=1606681 RepID=UPI001C8A7BAA|nr:uncharacterized protein LOC122342847 [Puntigrus tetrazona]
MSFTSSESQNVPDDPHRPRSDTFSAELELRNSFESDSEEACFDIMHCIKMSCSRMFMQDRGCNDGLGLLSVGGISSCESQIVRSPPMSSASLHTSCNSLEAAGPSESMDFCSDHEVSSIESTSLGVSPADSVDSSTENHVSLRKKVKNRICSLFKRTWNAIKRPSFSCETLTEPFTPPSNDTDLDGADSSRLADPRLAEWSFDSANNPFEGGRDNSLELLSISSDISSTEERSWSRQSGPAREECACSDRENTYANRVFPEPEGAEWPKWRLLWRTAQVVYVVLSIVNHSTLLDI